MPARHLLLPLLLVFATALAAPAQDTAAVRTVTVRASATADAAPDRARVRLSVTSRGKTAREASQANAGRATEVLERLRRGVGEGGKVTTGGYRLNAEYDYGKPGAGAPRRLLGYVAVNDLVAETSELAAAGTLVDAAVDAGADEVGAIEFYLADDEGARRQALLEAGRRARAQAETLAESLGVRLGSLLEATTGSDGVEPQPRFARMAMAEADTGSALAPGDVSVAAEITAVFAIE
jgi:uncharacterized protein YggE